MRICLSAATRRRPSCSSEPGVPDLEGKNQNRDQVSSCQTSSLWRIKSLSSKAAFLFFSKFLKLNEEIVWRVGTERRRNMVITVTMTITPGWASWFQREWRPLLRRQALCQALELLLAQLDFVVQLPLLDDERRLHLDEVAVVFQVLGVQVSLHDGKHQPLSAVQVLLQLLGVVMLPHQQLPLLGQRSLEGEGGDLTRYSGKASCS